MSLALIGGKSVTTLWPVLLLVLVLVPLALVVVGASLCIYSLPGRYLENQ